MKKILIPILILFLFCTVRIHAQTSPIAQMNQQNVPILNDNIQLLNNGVSKITGLFSQYFSNGFLSPDHGGTGQDSSMWASGDTVVMTNQGVWGHTSSALHGIQFFTASGSFTSPITGYVYITEVGAGGGGGGGVADIGGGGGGGQAIINFPFSVTSGNIYTIFIGAGGIGGTNAPTDGTDGSAGGNTSFDVVTATGGGGGHRGNIGTGGSGGSTPPLGISGEDGQVGSSGGLGGGTFFGVTESGAYGVGADGKQGGSGASGPSGSNGFVEVQY